MPDSCAADKARTCSVLSDLIWLALRPVRAEGDKACTCVVVKLDTCELDILETCVALKPDTLVLLVKLPLVIKRSVLLLPTLLIIWFNLFATTSHEACACVIAYLRCRQLHNKLEH